MKNELNNNYLSQTLCRLRIPTCTISSVFKAFNQNY